MNLVTFGKMLRRSLIKLPSLHAALWNVARIAKLYDSLVSFSMFCTIGLYVGLLSKHYFCFCTFLFLALYL